MHGGARTRCLGCLPRDLQHFLSSAWDGKLGDKICLQTVNTTFEGILQGGAHAVRTGCTGHLLGTFCDAGHVAVLQRKTAGTHILLYLIS